MMYDQNIDISIKPVRPLLSADMITPYPDILVWDFRHPTEAASYGYINLSMRRGQLVIHQYGSEDSRLPHELGHLITLPMKRWWVSDTLSIDFRFRSPTTRKGVLQLCEHEIAATVIQHEIVENYLGWLPIRPEFLIRLQEYCEQNYACVHPEGISIDWLQQRYNEERLKNPIKTVLKHWNKLVRELRGRRWLHAADLTEQKPSRLL